jgi:hypothetical protein
MRSNTRRVVGKKHIGRPIFLATGGCPYLEYIAYANIKAGLLKWCCHLLIMTPVGSTDLRRWMSTYTDKMNILWDSPRESGFMPEGFLH